MNAARPFASQAQAEAGVATDVAMNPLTTDQAIVARGGALFASAAEAVPAGGTTGQVLAKNTNADNDVIWTTAGTGDLLAINNLSKGFLRLSGNPCDMGADVPLELTADEEEALTRDRALTTDSKGGLTLVGLSGGIYLVYRAQAPVARGADR